MDSVPPPSTDDSYSTSSPSQSNAASKLLTLPLSLVWGTLQKMSSHEPLNAALDAIRQENQGLPEDRRVRNMADLVARLVLQGRSFSPPATTAQTRDEGMRGGEEEDETPRIVCADQLPAWFAPYEYVRSGYRVSYSALQCVGSMFQWHNETVNIWTELCPLLLFVAAWCYYERVDTVWHRHPAGPVDSAFVNAGVLGLLIARPLCSGLAHVFHGMSQRAFILWWGLDYASILVATMAGCAVSGRFAFYCMGAQQTFFYVSLGGLFLSTLISVLFIAHSTVRTSSFSLYVVFAFCVPFSYQLYLKHNVPGHDVPDTYIVLQLLNIACVCLGLLIKAVSVPERWAPGSILDYLGNSHQIWHIFVNGGNAVSYFAWRIYLDWRFDNPCPKHPY